MIRAIYRAREDGDYDFIAAFAEEHDYDEHPADTYAKEIEAEGEEVVVKWFEGLTSLVDVMEGIDKAVPSLTKLGGSALTASDEMKELKDEITALQARLEEGDVITIWKDEFQIKLKGNAATNYAQSYDYRDVDDISED